MRFRPDQDWRPPYSRDQPALGFLVVAAQPRGRVASMLPGSCRSPDVQKGRPQLRGAQNVALRNASSVSVDIRFVVHNEEVRARSPRARQSLTSAGAPCPPMLPLPGRTASTSTQLLVGVAYTDQLQKAQRRPATCSAEATSSTSSSASSRTARTSFSIVVGPLRRLQLAITEAPLNGVRGDGDTAADCPVSSCSPIQRMDRNLETYIVPAASLKWRVMRHSTPYMIKRRAGRRSCPPIRSTWTSPRSG